ncbi:MAG TPA: DUF4214 domain-containing protein [Thermoanaerobaculia bacterium]
MRATTLNRLLPTLPLALLTFAAMPARAVVPTQWIAKMYTEALGRIPDQTGWEDSVNNFNSAGCTAATLKSHGRPFWLSTEYTNLGYDNAARLLSLYRGVLNREPDPTGFTSNLNALNAGTAWSTIVDQLFDSGEFATLATTICSASGTGSYSFNSRAAMALPVTSPGFTGTQSALQSALNSAGSGGTVTLAQKALVTLTSTLNIPAGVTLTTYGAPPHAKYALMGRLVRAGTFATPMVTVQPDGKLLNVWVDGARTNVGYGDNEINVETEGGTGTAVSNCLISNSAGWSSFHALGTAEWSHICGGETVTNNLVTAYSSLHFKQTGAADISQWTDGLSIACENADVENNQIVDATDVGIVLFRAYPAVQKSLIKNNTILSAGNPSYGAITLDPLSDTAGADYTGSSVQDNVLWTGPRTHFDIALSVGARPWFGAGATKGTGASVTGNNTGTLSAIADSAVAVSGMLSAYVQNNAITADLQNTCGCPNDPAHPTITTVSVGASVSSGWASGTIQPYTDVLYAQCVGH